MFNLAHTLHISFCDRFSTSKPLEALACTCNTISLILHQLSFSIHRAHRPCALGGVISLPLSASSLCANVTIHNAQHLCALQVLLRARAIETQVAFTNNNPLCLHIHGPALAAYHILMILTSFSVLRRRRCAGGTPQLKACFLRPRHVCRPLGHSARASR